MKTLMFRIILGSVLSSSAFAFTQLGGAGSLPMGHEWLTRTSALEVLNADHVIAADPADPRSSWTLGLAKNTDLSNAQNEVARLKGLPNNNARYEPGYDYIYAAIIGERWVDTAGANVVKANLDKVNCFDAIAQEPADLQQDHYMRRYDDEGAQGGVDAAARAQTRFINHFVNAAMAQEKNIKALDGGAFSSLYKVDQNYFLFGRAVHLFQDSFSPEHTVRLADDNYQKVRQVKAYLCSRGAEQHTHDLKAALNFTSGDVIWQADTRLDSGWNSYKVSSMKPVALVAMEASKDLWAAFIRTMSVPSAERRAIAQQEAQTLSANWLSYNEAEALSWYTDEAHRDDTYVLNDGEAGKGNNQYDCMLGLGIESGSQAIRVKELDALRKQCLFNIQATPGFADVADTHMDIPYNWQWTSSTWKDVPAGWEIPQLSADTGKTVTIRNSITGAALVAPEGIGHNHSVYSKSGNAIEFVAVIDNGEMHFRAKNNADLFLSYNMFSGKGLLYNYPNQAAYKVERIGNLWTIENTYWNDYLWFDTSSERLYLSRKGDDDKAHSQWIIDGL